MNGFWKLLLMAALLALPASLSRAEGDDGVDAAALFRNANALYGQGKYAEATGIYQGIVDRGFSSASLYYNLGNAYFKQGVLGRAVLNYRRAWRLSPGDPEIAKNLEYALENVQDDVAALPLPLHERIRFMVVRQLPLGTWLALGSLIYFLTAVWVLLILLVPALRRPAAPVLKILLGLLAAALICAVLAWAYYRTPRAIILDPKIAVRYGPQEKDAVAFELHEGTEARIVRDDRSGWVQISLPDGKSGWVTATSVERI
jgi:tetratricopeptide (TPR) repeat protein